MAEALLNIENLNQKQIVNKAGLINQYKTQCPTLMQKVKTDLQGVVSILNGNTIDDALNAASGKLRQESRMFENSGRSAAASGGNMDFLQNHPEIKALQQMLSDPSINANPGLMAELTTLIDHIQQGVINRLRAIYQSANNQAVPQVLSDAFDQQFNHVRANAGLTAKRPQAQPVLPPPAAVPPINNINQPPPAPIPVPQQNPINAPLPPVAPPQAIPAYSIPTAKPFDSTPIIQPPPAPEGVFDAKVENQRMVDIIEKAKKELANISQSVEMVNRLKGIPDTDLLLSLIDFYDLLGVNMNTSIDDIKKKYKKLAMILHPDPSGTSDDNFKILQAIGAVISDPAKKDLYDKYHLYLGLLYELNKGKNTEFTASKVILLLCRRLQDINAETLLLLAKGQNAVDNKTPDAIRGRLYNDILGLNITPDIVAKALNSNDMQDAARKLFGINNPHNLPPPPTVFTV